MGNKIQIITGGQYGSEAKGHIAAYLVVKDKIDYAVRTGATNAGHTVTYNGARYAMQQLPVGWIRKGTTLVLGAGALIDPIILAREVEMVSAAIGKDIRKHVLIDYRAYIHQPSAAEKSKASGRHYMIGATGKGCSEALMDRIRLRGVEDYTVGRDKDLCNTYTIVDTERLLNTEFDNGANIQLEGTQGNGLDLYLGPYPYTTHKQTVPAQWMAEAGLSPALPTDIVMVVRTYPIRVAGNSGPLSKETSWPRLARAINLARLTPLIEEADIFAFERAVAAVTRDSWQGEVPKDSNGLDQYQWSAAERSRYMAALSEIHKQALSMLDSGTVERLRALFEMTTVTKKLRRVALLDSNDLATAARQVRPHRIAVTFMNYIFPREWFTNAPPNPAELDWLKTYISDPTRCPVTLISRGPDSAHVVEL